MFFSGVYVGRLFELRFTTARSACIGNNSMFSFILVFLPCLDLSNFPEDLRLFGWCRSEAGRIFFRSMI